ncbi:hypothetical protein [Streptomyces atratus]|uniref:hypothetical protein n=1 Tax=Streptomyces atratus TaxID=1893 RepID=UPI003665A3CF
MRKIPTLFIRNPDDRRYVLPDVSPGCDWVVEGEGHATRKWDGTCMRLDEAGDWWARREVKPGKTPPSGYLLIGEDPITGKKVGWEPIGGSPFVKYHAEALTSSTTGISGTYELIGPKINGNLDGFDQHILVRHGWAPFSVRQDYAAAPLDYDGLRAWLHARPYEGIVWHRSPGDPNTEMVKIKRKDFPAAQ